MEAPVLINSSLSVNPLSANALWSLAIGGVAPITYSVTRVIPPSGSPVTVPFTLTVNGVEISDSTVALGGIYDYTAHATDSTTPTPVTVSSSALQVAIPSTLPTVPPAFALPLQVNIENNVSSISLRQGDIPGQLYASFLDGNNDPLSIAGWPGTEINFIIKDTNGNVTGGGPCTIQNYLRLGATYQWLPVDSAIIGQYTGYFSIALPYGLGVFTVPQLNVLQISVN